ncbi:AMP-binding protein [Mycobacterium vicinigordonae]|uniref:AMP-binding protein n=1 Tax=Mycobacterium vicinigordonae TaxID=1719132 RepID=A0A7D6IBU3_9MYCO|nr:AMP-binding protein [Mycobacterium vicinigordonae]QLL09817.1 AMP-binding protein [Mycobacterium vicinigordonae]
MVNHAALRMRWYAEGFYSAGTCLDAVNTAAREHAQLAVTFVAGGSETSVTVGEIHSAAMQIAAGMQRLGIRSGDAVAVQLTNRLECAVTYQAVLLCGAVLVPIVHSYGPSEVRFILSDSRARLFVMPARFRSTSFVERVPSYADLAELGHIVVVDAAPGPGYLSWESIGADRAGYVAPTVRSDDVCALLYTSGTVSAPKGVRHSHNSLLSELASLPELLAGDTGAVQLVTFPPGHVAGLTSMLRPLVSGTRSVFLDHWDPAVAADLIARFSVTSTSGSPFHLEGLLEVSDVRLKLATLREFLTGAATVSEELGRRAAAAGITAFRCYGMTEHPTVTGARARDPLRVRMATDGMPMRGCAVRVLGPDGADQPVGVDGEVVVQGPDQFIGYRNQALDADAFTADGWFRTGDLGHLDAQQRLTITDRIKDVIIRGGETMSSGQIEDVLHSHPAVAEAAAVAAPDSRYGEVVAAVVVLQPGARLDLAELARHFAAAGLARHKTPERLVIVDALPRTALGKVRKADLRNAHFPRP